MDCCSPSPNIRPCHMSLSGDNTQLTATALCSFNKQCLSCPVSGPHQHCSLFFHWCHSPAGSHRQMTHFCRQRGVKSDQPASCSPNTSSPPKWCWIWSFNWRSYQEHWTCWAKSSQCPVKSPTSIIFLENTKNGCNIYNNLILLEAHININVETLLSCLI